MGVESTWWVWTGNTGSCDVCVGQGWARPASSVSTGSPVTLYQQPGTHTRAPGHSHGGFGRGPNAGGWRVAVAHCGWWAGCREVGWGSGQVVVTGDKSYRVQAHQSPFTAPATGTPRDPWGTVAPVAVQESDPASSGTRLSPVIDIQRHTPSGRHHPHTRRPSKRSEPTGPGYVVLPGPWMPQESPPNGRPRWSGLLPPTGSTGRAPTTRGWNRKSWAWTGNALFGPTRSCSRPRDVGGVHGPGTWARSGQGVGGVGSRRRAMTAVVRYTMRPRASSAPPVCMSWGPRLLASIACS